jgi:hypothetical protein
MPVSKVSLVLIYLVLILSNQVRYATTTWWRDTNLVYKYMDLCMRSETKV